MEQLITDYDSFQQKAKECRDWLVAIESEVVSADHMSPMVQGLQEQIEDHQVCVIEVKGFVCP